MTVRLRWWREVAFVLGFYAVYTFIRNQFGSAAVPRGEALANAHRVIDAERALGLFQEARIQHWFLDWHGFIQFWNVFYGTFHFVVTAGCIIWLFRRFPEQYVKWRTTLACTTALALIGFSLFPLLPPRLLPASFDFVDTLKDYGGLWSFDSGAMSKVSNQYAAMPSLHFGWSLWCACVIVPRARHQWSKVLAVAYPLATLFAIVVTGNHYWLDAVGGAVILAGGYLFGRWWAQRAGASATEVILERSGR
jgi:hypothetical protein